MRICPSVLFIEQSVAIKQLWGTIQWLWQCSFQHTLGYSLALMVHNTLSLCSMADGWKRSQKYTNIDNDTISPPPAPIYLLLGQMKLAQAQHCYITTMWKQNNFIRLTATHSWEKTKPASVPPSWMRNDEVRSRRERRWLFSGACRTSVLCSTRRTLQREKAC